MPGILPMKVIKVGTSAQSRIAQACDRCRSKKIRCDGTRPTCTQCANVGFECKTSDKLSRRAFPRGYTESLEERVRALESEVRELKDLLDEKDEKIDMLSNMHSNQSRPRQPSAAATSNANSPASAKEPTPAKEDTFRVQASPLLLGVDNSDSYFMGASSGRSFIESFKRTIQENGKPCSDFNPEAFLHIQGCQPLAEPTPVAPARMPPRLFSDRCVNVYFQEWAPLFPVIHKPTFLHLYEDFVSDADKIKSNQKVAQLYLVFGIAALSSDRPDTDQIAACEVHWQKALDSILMENTMGTLQCLVLALMYCCIRADYKRLLHYKGVAVGLSHRLGLHQSQKRFSFGALTIETRKKVFWTLYTLDCITAAVLGLPKVLKEDDIHAEYPSDCDDDYVTEKGFQPTLPGEHTKLSCALALFRLSRILAKVLEKNYPAATTHELSLQQIMAMDAELSEWSENLPAHLKLTFAQDKPSTDVTGSRSPILALAFYYIRTLIHRPAVGSSLGPKAAPCLLTIGESSKHMIQIMQLLEERNMSFSFCLNRVDVLVLCGMTLLYQGLDLKHDSKLMRDTQRLVKCVLEMLQKAEAPGTHALKRVASMIISLDEPAAPTAAQASPKAVVTAHMASPRRNMAQNGPSYSGEYHGGTGLGETDVDAQQERLRRMTMPSASSSRPKIQQSRSRASMDNIARAQAQVQVQVQVQAHAHAQAQAQAQAQAHDNAVRHRYSLSHTQQPMMDASPNQHSAEPRLDYPSLNDSTSDTRTRNQPPSSPIHSRLPLSRITAQMRRPLYPAKPGFGKNGPASGLSTSEWEALLGAMDGGQANVYDAIYGGPGVNLEPSDNTPPANGEWPDTWDLTAFNAGEQPGPPQSVFSLSDDSLSSADERAGTGDVFCNVGDDDYQSGMLQQHQQHQHHHHHHQAARSTNDDGLMLDDLNSVLGL